MIPTRHLQRVPFGNFIGLTRDENSFFALYLADKSVETILPAAVSRTPDPNKPSNTPAEHYCRTLDYCGHTDWYLPVFNELVLVRHSGIKFNTDYILNETNYRYAALFTYPEYTTAITFYSGSNRAENVLGFRVLPFDKPRYTFWTPTTPKPVRPVRREVVVQLA